MANSHGATPDSADGSLNFRAIRAFVTFAFVGVHVSAKDGVDSGLVAAFSLEPRQQVGVQAHGDELFRFRKNDLGPFPKIFIGRVGIGVALDTRAEVDIAEVAQGLPISVGLAPLRCFASSGVSHGVPTSTRK